MGVIKKVAAKVKKSPLVKKVTTAAKRMPTVSKALALVKKVQPIKKVASAVRKVAASGVVRNVVKAVAPRASQALNIAKKITGKVVGRGSTGTTASRGMRTMGRKSKGLNINKYVKKLVKAKMDAKLMAIKVKSINSIK
jgi:hypothetical protein